MNELEMREVEAPSPKTPEELAIYIASLVDREHDYGTCVYAMSLAAVASFNYVAGKLGVTGFQASCADLDVIRRTRHLNGPFMLIKAHDALFPQYDIPRSVADAIAGWAPWLQSEAVKLLAEASSNAHPNVVAHWKRLAGAA